MKPSHSGELLRRMAVALSPRVWLLLLMACIVLAASLLTSQQPVKIMFYSVAATLVCLALITRWIAFEHQSAVHRMQRQMAQFVENDPAPSFSTSHEGLIGYQNQAAVERFGVQPGQSLVRALGDLFANPPEVLHRLQGRAGKHGAVREDLVTRRGHARLSVHAIGLAGFLWRLEEIVERGTAGRGAEHLAIPMMTVSRNGAILFLNEAMRRLVGVRAKTIETIFPVLPLVSGMETRVLTPEGLQQVFIAEFPSASGLREVFVVPLQGPRPQAPIEHSSFEDLPVALLKIAANGRVLAANRLARGLISHDLADDMRLWDLVEGLGRPVSDWMSDALAGRTLNRPEVLRAIHAPEDVFLQVTLRRVNDPGDASLVAILNDATELKTLEAQFVQSQKMQAIGQLAGGVAHDFNNLLTAISGHCDLLLLSHDEGDPEYADLVQIRQNTNRAASLVGQLLAFSRKQTLQPEPIDLREALGDLAHLLNRLVGEKIKLCLVYATDLLPMRADKRQLEQVIMNLVVNARDAMPLGGEIVIQTENRVLSEALRRDRAVVGPGEYVVIKVRDEGVGIPADRLHKIFEPFYTTKRPGEGTGLGLSTAYGIVKQTGGFIFVDSVQGVGSTFTLYFPAFSSVSDSLAGAINGAAPDFANLHETGAAQSVADLPADNLAATIVNSLPMTAPLATQPASVMTNTQGVNPSADPRDSVVLLVEDEAPVRAFASRALRLRGYTVIEAQNAEEALQTLADPGLCVDVFVTDVIMPGMDGPSWVREALKARPGVKVVFVSGYAEDAFADGQAHIPNSVFLPKPFSLSELTSTVQRQIH